MMRIEGTTVKKPAVDRGYEYLRNLERKWCFVCCCGVVGVRRLMGRVGLMGWGGGVKGFLSLISSSSPINI